MSRIIGHEDPMPDFRKLPDSPEAEQGLLGSMLISPDEVIAECIHKLNPECFHVPAHRTVYEVLISLWNAKAPIDLILLTQSLKDRGLLEQIGGPGFVTHLFTVTATAANASYYISILLDKWRLRTAIRIGTEITNAAYEPGANIEDVGTLAQRRLLEVVEAGNSKGRQTRTMAANVTALIESIECYDSSKKRCLGIPTGISGLDEATMGLHDTDLTVIGGGTGEGKSVIGWQIMRHIAVAEKLPVGGWSGEMSAKQLTSRMLADLATVDSRKLLQNSLDPLAWQDVHAAIKKLSKSNLFINDRAGMNILEICAEMRRMKSEYGIRAFCVDYIQKIRGTGKRRTETKTDVVTEATAILKDMADELSIPVLALAMTEEGKLKWAGAIKEDANTAIIIEHDSEFVSWLNIKKQRNGPNTKVPVTFMRKYNRFEDRKT